VRERRHSADREPGRGLRFVGRRAATTAAPRTVRSFDSSTRAAPEQSTTIGAPSARKTMLFTISATTQPISRAASWAVCVDAGKRVTAIGTPRSAACAITRATLG